MTTIREAGVGPARGREAHPDAAASEVAWTESHFPGLFGDERARAACLLMDQVDGQGVTFGPVLFGADWFRLLGLIRRGAAGA